MMYVLTICSSFLYFHSYKIQKDVKEFPGWCWCFFKPSVRCTWRWVSTDFQTIMSGGSFTLRELPRFHPWLSYEGRFVDKWPHPPSPRSLTHWLAPTPHVKDSCLDEISRNWRRSAWQFALPSWNYPSESGECLVEGDAKQRKCLMGPKF